MNRDTFLRYLQHEKRFSPHTVEAYMRDLGQFEVYLTDTYGLAQAERATYQHIRSWAVALIGQQAAPATVRRKLSTLKSWYGFLRRQGALAHDPTLKVTLPKSGRRLPPVVRTTEMDALLDGVHFTDDFAGRRDRLALSLLYHTGIRRGEALSLRVPDVDMSAMHLRVMGKGSKERLIPFGRELKADLSGYLEARATLAADTDALLLTEAGRPMYPKALYNIVHRYLSGVTTQGQRSPHVLRHTFATHLSDNGADLNAVKSLLGHSSLAATQRYTHNTIQKLKAVYEAAHPKAKEGDF